MAQPPTLRQGVWRWQWLAVGLSVFLVAAWLLHPHGQQQLLRHQLVAGVGTAAAVAGPEAEQHWSSGLSWDNAEGEKGLQSLADTMTSLQSRYSGQTQKLATRQAGHVPLHWVLTSCTRRNWGRMISTTLLSGLLNGLQPDLITIVWCHPYNQSEVNSLLYNLRTSHQISVVFAPFTLPIHPCTTYLSALMAPLLVERGQGSDNHPAPRRPRDMYLLITEDDIVFQPDAHAKLYELTRSAVQKAGGAPYLLTLYNPPQDLDGRVEDVLRLRNPERPAPLPRYTGRAAPSAGTVVQSKLSYWYGAQALLYSPHLGQYMLRYFYQVMTGALNRSEGYALSADHLIKDFLERYGCSFRYNPSAPCHVYNVEPSLVQHVGTSSATFAVTNNNTATSRYHMAVDFPAHVGMPGLDPDGTW